MTRAGWRRKHDPGVVRSSGPQPAPLHTIRAGFWLGLAAQTARHRARQSKDGRGYWAAQVTASTVSTVLSGSTMREMPGSRRNPCLRPLKLLNIERVAFGRPAHYWRWDYSPGHGS